jgi:hypothetical protein
MSVFSAGKGTDGASGAGGGEANDSGNMGARVGSVKASVVSWLSDRSR